ncbi:hypothetical protein [Pollutibacter soli]|uniref:nuclear transport factor 2 family protein n=1 Tax=Pollutibacter soli TaxID=3034157 RepID=UPI003013A304
MKKKIVLPLFFLLIIMAGCNTSTPEKTNEVVARPESDGPVDVLDSSKSKMLEESIKAFAVGNMDQFTSAMADDIKFYYPAPGDSLVGKAAVQTYYGGRWKLIDSIKMVNPTFLAVNVKRSNSVMPGEWLMAWYSFQINYKSGNAIFLPVHTVAHENGAGKFDVMVMYYDMHKPMMAQRK